VALGLTGSWFLPVQAEGASSLRAIAAELHAHGVLIPADKLDWSPAQVQRLLSRAPA
jgi:hypothetical protein